MSNIRSLTDQKSVDRNPQNIEEVFDYVEDRLSRKIVQAENAGCFGDWKKAGVLQIEIDGMRDVLEIFRTFYMGTKAGRNAR